VNTKQLTVLWYTAIAVAIILFFAPGKALRPFAILAGVIVIGSTLIYTFRPHPQARVRMLFVTVATPLAILLLIGFGLDHLAKQFEVP
jgi:hypothetical protein